MSLPSAPFSDPEKPEPPNVEKDAESRCTPEMYACNGSASRKTCKHQHKRERLERERELLRRQEETPNQEEEEVQEEGTEGEDTNAETLYVVGNTLRTSSGQDLQDSCNRPCDVHVKYP